MIRLIFASMFLVLFMCATATADPYITPTNTSIRIPAPIKGNLVIYRVGYTQCSMFLSDEGMAKGTVQPSCILLPPLLVPAGGFRFEVIDVITTTGD